MESPEACNVGGLNWDEEIEWCLRKLKGKLRQPGNKAGERGQMT